MSIAAQKPESLSAISSERMRKRISGVMGNFCLKAKHVQCRRRRTETNRTYQCLVHVSTAQSMINHLELRIIMPLDGIQYLTFSLFDLLL